MIAMALFFFYKFRAFFSNFLNEQYTFMKHLIFILKVILPFFFFSLTITAQERYKDEITDSVRVETFTYAFKDSQSLDMDVYFPAFDNQSNRALIFYVHGGGFSGGERNEPGICLLY